mmetsp:Transcript_22366/g.49520  ORF Transcript_22366/g.49520 Transcript_22366/m.49520 type:complete len:201 (-) Transcript_22366:517-1119(-)
MAHSAPPAQSASGISVTPCGNGMGGGKCNAAPAMSPAGVGRRLSGVMRRRKAAAAAAAAAARSSSAPMVWVPATAVADPLALVPLLTLPFLHRLRLASQLELPTPMAESPLSSAELASKPAETERRMLCSSCCGQFSSGFVDAPPGGSAVCLSLRDAVLSAFADPQGATVCAAAGRGADLVVVLHFQRSRSALEDAKTST